ncbi:MAG: biotin/lipoyl-containing protein, partial [Pseudomonadota bacterium]
MSIHTIKLPDVGEGVTEAEFVELHVAVGDMVEPDQNLADVMTDKATVEVPSPRKGKVVWIGPEPGEVIAVGSEIIKLELEGGAADNNAEDEEEFLNPMEAMMAEERTAKAEAPAEPEPVAAPVSSSGTYTIKLPDVGEGVTEAEFVEIHVKVGDRVAADQNLADVMTDKATVEIPSPRDGVVAWIGAEVGETVAVGSEIITLEVEGEAQAEAAAPAPQAEKSASPPVAAPTGGKVLAAPAVRAR